VNRSRIGLLAFCVAFCLAPMTGTARAQAPVELSAADRVADVTVRQRSADEVTAFIKNDSVQMAALWSDDFVVTNPLNRFATKRQVLGMVRSGFLVITAYDRQIEYDRIYGDMAIMAGSETVVWGGKMPNAGKTEHLRFTAVWMKQAGGWQEIARHANIIPQT
jgi:hypothetical protein